MLTDYFRETKFILDDVSFEYRSGHYRGHGVMTWKPDVGFHIEAFLERHGPPLPKKWGIGEVGIIPRDDFRSIRLKLRHNEYAVAPNVPITNKYDLFAQKYLSITVNRVVFFSTSNQVPAASSWFASGLYKTGDRLLLPDKLHREETINGEVIGRGFSLAGLWHSEEGKQKIVGHLDNKNRNLVLTWNLAKTEWSKMQIWAWPDAASQALSILVGESVQLLQKEVFRGSQIITDMRRSANTETLGVLSFFNNDSLEKETFIGLSKFLVRNPSQATICVNLYKQALEAARQKSWQAMELLLSTALEAALRSIDGVPFKTKKSKSRVWAIKASLNSFCKVYLSDEWVSVQQNILRTYFRLRIEMRILTG